MLWPSYEGANDWKIFQLVPKKPDDEKGAGKAIQCVLNAFEARVLLMMRIGGAYDCRSEACAANWTASAADQCGK